MPIHVQTWILNVLKNVCGKYNFREISAIIQKLHSNIRKVHEPLISNLTTIDWNVHIFWGFEFFEILLVQTSSYRAQNFFARMHYN